MELRTRILTPKLRAELKKPFGVLIQGPAELTIEKVKELIEKGKPPKVITIGDVTTANLIRFEIPPDLCVVDNMVMRKRVKPILVKTTQTLHTTNPPGTITTEAWLTVKKGVSARQKTRIVVDGEEDLLVIPAVIFAPEKSIVAYGQPNQGIVVTAVTKQKKLKCHRIIDSMEKAGHKQNTKS